MTTPWPLELIEKFGLPKIHQLRKMQTTQATIWIDSMTIELSQEEKIILLSATQPDAPEGVPVVKRLEANAYEANLIMYRYRAVFCAAAWCAGASWGQLANLFGVKRQSIAASVTNLLPPPKLQHKLGVDMPGLETLAAWKNWYYQEIEANQELSIRELATRMITIFDD